MALSFIRLFILPALLLGLFACATQKPQSEEPVDRFTIIDTNKDGQVVIEEFQAAFPDMGEKDFQAIDRNKNGGIDRMEWYDYLEGHDASRFKGAPDNNAPLNNIPGDPLIPPPDSNDLPLMRPQYY